MPKTPTQRARRYALTFFTEPTFVFDTSLVRYFVAGRETCPTTGNVHYQAYIELFKPTSLKALKTLVDDEKVHAEACKGNAATNIKYCKKDGDIFREEGTAAQQGQRNDLVSLRQHFKDKKRLREAIESDELIGPVARYPRLVNQLELLYSTQRSQQTELHIFWGAPGTGKSHTAYEEAKQLGPVYFKPTGNWWDGYEQQPCVIFEDFRGECGLAQLLRLADKYPLRVPIKGGFKEFTSSRLYITSNLDITDWFNAEARGYETSLAALKRRITRKVHFDTPFQKTQT